MRRQGKTEVIFKIRVDILNIKVDIDSGAHSRRKTETCTVKDGGNLLELMHMLQRFSCVLGGDAHVGPHLN